VLRCEISDAKVRRAVSELAIEVKGLVKRFDDVVAVAGIDLAVRRGECVGLLGPNGAGKTTTVEILEGIQHATEGQVWILGRTWQEDPTGIRERMGLALQETKFYGRLTVLETLQLFRSFYSRGISAEEALQRVQLEEKRDVHVQKLSGGQRQRLAVATALVGDPEVLFLDEPTTGLDPQSRRSLWNVIDALKGRGRTVVLTTHYMEEAQHLCDRIIIVDRGRIIAEGTPAQLISRLGAAQVIDLETSPVLDVAAFAQVPGLAASTSRNGSVTLSVHQLHTALPAVLAVAEDRRAALTRISTRQATLDDVFLSLTGHSLREDGNGH
jgi:ABC-2 type transport system ATP-binding protein